MYLVFIDDSSQKGIREGMGQLISIGGIFIGEEKLQSLQNTVNKITRKYNIPDDCELKWSPPRTNWIYSNLQGQARQDCYQEVLEATRSHNVRVVVVTFDTGRTTIKGAKATAEVLKYLIDRIRMHLKDINSLGLIIADQPGGGTRQHSRFLYDALQIIQHGSSYVMPKQIPINVLTTPSKLIRLIQVADLVTGITTAMISGNTKYAEPLFDTVKGMMIKNYLGYIGGTGLKLFPDDIVNLYYWVLGETSYMRGNAGVTLPWKNFYYTKDEFKQ